MERYTGQSRAARLQGKPWNDSALSVPPEIFTVPGMLWHQEKRMLYYLAASYYAGEGVIADMGSFLGGSTICFARGLRQRGWTKRSIHSYDLFKLGEFEREQYFPQNPPEGLKTRQIFECNVEGFGDLIAVHEGDVLGFIAAEAIEILFVDIAKSYKVFDHLVASFFPALIPGKSLVILQDYLSGNTGPWHHIMMEKLSNYFEYVVDADRGSVIFLLKERIPDEVISECQWNAIPMAEKLELMQRAIDKQDTDEKKQLLVQNQTILLDGKDLDWGMHYHKLSPV
jgi:hypothetical protein